MSLHKLNFFTCLEQSASLDALSFRYWLSELDSSSFSASCSRLSVGVTVPKEKKTH